jgi:TonB-dependent SusC/RagA subfamily outer membrane receptor
VTLSIQDSVQISYIYTFEQLSDKTSPDCLVIIDGKESNRDELSKLSPNKIHSFTIIKDDTATKTYGEKGKNGVIIIETKQKL